MISVGEMPRLVLGCTASMCSAIRGSAAVGTRPQPRAPRARAPDMSSARLWVRSTRSSTNWMSHLERGAAAAANGQKRRNGNSLLPGQRLLFESGPVSEVASVVRGPPAWPLRPQKCAARAEPGLCFAQVCYHLHLRHASCEPQGGIEPPPSYFASRCSQSTELLERGKKEAQPLFWPLTKRSSKWSGARFGLVRDIAKRQEKSNVAATPWLRRPVSRTATAPAAASPRPRRSAPAAACRRSATRGESSRSIAHPPRCAAVAATSGCGPPAPHVRCHELESLS